MEQLEDNLGALTVTITDEDRARIDTISPPGRMIVPFYEANFGPNLYRIARMSACQLWLMSDTAHYRTRGQHR
jgi:hypothetical protein